MYDLDFGGSVIDTPGIRGFGLVELDIKEIAELFPEFFAEKEKCKFFNCLHKDEPNCAVKTAVKSVLIAVDIKIVLRCLLKKKHLLRRKSY